MLIAELFQNPLIFLEFIAAILVGITIHEAAHAYSAYLLGDPTAKMEGRVSLNPIVHIDPWGFILLLLVGFGWGKPVPVNPQMLRGGIRDEIITSLSGIGANLVLSAILAMIIRFIPGLPLGLIDFLVILISINLVLAAFNILPIPPLDGSRIIKPIIGEENYLKFETLGLPILLVLLALSYFGFPILQTIIYGIVNFLFKLLLGSSFTPF